MRVLSLLIFLLISTAGSLSAQMMYSPKNMALGGGGTAYITGYEALFVNPANLQIRDKNYRFQLSLGQVGSYHNSPFQIIEPVEMFNSYYNRFSEIGAGQNLISQEDRINFIDRYYTDSQTSQEFLTQTEIHWFGLKFFRDEKSYALALRTRVASRYRLGRGHFDLTPIEIDDFERIDQSLTHRFQTLHELSFGYSNSFAFLNGLFPRLSEFIIGVAPKIVASGSMADVEYRNRYDRPIGESQWVRESQYSLQSSGAMTQAIQQFMLTGDAATSTGNAFVNNDLFKPSGVGVGLDVGLTYLLTFGDDLSTIRRDEESTEKSLRLSFSLTDLGAVHYFDDPYTISYNREEAEADEPGLSDRYFSGSPGEDLFFLNQQEEHPLLTDWEHEQDELSFETILPTAFNAGALFQINRVKLMGDFRIGLTDNALVTPKFMGFVGTEIRLLPFLPLRAGTRFATRLPGYYSFGTGIETQRFDISASVQFRSKAGEPTLEPVGASAVALKLYF